MNITYRAAIRPAGLCCCLHSARAEHELHQDTVSGGPNGVRAHAIAVRKAARLSAAMRCPAAARLLFGRLDALQQEQAHRRSSSYNANVLALF